MCGSGGSFITSSCVCASVEGSPGVRIHRNKSHVVKGELNARAIGKLGWTLKQSCTTHLRMSNQKLGMLCMPPGYKIFLVGGLGSLPGTTVANELGGSWERGSRQSYPTSGYTI